MDPLTQGALGAAVAQAAPTKNKSLLVAGGLGFAAGVAADLDALIRSASDPLLFLEYHRHFTHSLIFVPVGGLICALLFQLVLSRRLQISFLQVFACSTFGYGTHALLDAATSYGTSLFWPFSDDRIAWSIVPIVDPVFTIPLVTLCLIAAIRKKKILSYGALIWIGVYLSLGILQHNFALVRANEIAIARGHDPLRIEVKPSFANILVWKTIYETPQRFYVDAVRVGIRPKIFYGTSLPKLDQIRDLPWLNLESQQAEDVQRFSHFSDGFIAMDPDTPNRIIDVRYSFVPNDVSPLWSIELSPNATQTAHVQYLTHREEARASFQRLLGMLFSR